MSIRDHPPLPAPPAPPPPAPPAPAPVSTAAPPPAPAPSSRLGHLALSLVMLGIGVTGLLDLSGVPVPGSVYLAVPLAVVGSALVLGAWYGRARWLVVPGVVLTAALGIATAAETASDSTGPVTWHPTTVNEVESTYTAGAGNAVLDLSDVDFAGQSRTVSVDIDLGNLTVIVPPTVDVRGDARVNVGNAVIFGAQSGGIGQSAHPIADDGPDGPGGGTLVIHAATDVGNVEVRR